MLFLVLSIITSTSLVIILKLFDRFKIDTFQAIVINYWVCTITGGVIENYYTFQNWQQVTNHEWLLPAILLGIFFIGLFNLMGYTAQKVGLTAVSVANKLSLVIPVVAAFIFFNEQITILKITAIALAIIAVVMVTYQKNDTQHRISIWHFILPIILFIGSGFNDSVVNYVQKKMLPAEESGLFVIWIFQIAAIIGSILLIVLFLLKKKIWQWRNILAGICLGVPNYFSMFYLIKALSNSGWQSSIVFPINNVSIVICSAITGIIFFKEKISTLQLTGILIACLSIFLLM